MKSTMEFAARTKEQMLQQQQTMKLLHRLKEQAKTQQQTHEERQQSTGKEEMLKRNQFERNARKREEAKEAKEA